MSARTTLFEALRSTLEVPDDVLRLIVEWTLGRKPHCVCSTTIDWSHDSLVAAGRFVFALRRLGPQPALGVLDATGTNVATVVLQHHQPVYEAFAATGDGDDWRVYRVFYASAQGLVRLDLGTGACRIVGTWPPSVRPLCATADEVWVDARTGWGPGQVERWDHEGHLLEATRAWPGSVFATRRRSCDRPQLLGSVLEIVQGDTTFRCPWTWRLDTLWYQVAWWGLDLILAGTDGLFVVELTQPLRVTRLRPGFYVAVATTPDDHSVWAVRTTAIDCRWERWVRDQ